MNAIYNNIIFLPFITSFVLTVLTTPISLIFIKKFGIFDDPKHHKHPAIIHKQPIPRGGGIPLFIGTAVGGWIGAHFAVIKGSKLIKKLFIVVTAILIVKSVIDLLLK